MCQLLECGTGLLNPGGKIVKTMANNTLFIFRLGMSEPDEQRDFGLAELFAGGDEPSSGSEERTDSDTNMEVEEDKPGSSDGTLKKRVADYIREKQLAGSGSTMADDKGSNMYQAIGRMNLKAMEVAGLNGATSPISGSWGSFRVAEDSRHKKSFERNIFQKKLNLSFSFDPDSLVCHNCGSRGPHQILPGDLGGRGGGRN